MTQANKDTWTSLEDVPLSFLLHLRVQSLFWEMIDKDFKRKIDNQSLDEINDLEPLHDIFDMVFAELTMNQLINILNKIEPNGLYRLMDELKKGAKK